LLKENFVKDLYEGQRFRDFFYVDEKSLKMTRAGKYFLDLKLRDKTGAVSAKVWDDAEKASNLFSKGDFIKIQASVESYQGSAQLRIQKIRKAGEAEYELSDFLRQTEKNIDEMFDSLISYVDSIENPWIKKLLELFFEDKDFARTFCKSPAAKTVHHSYLGGLLEHTLSMVRICDFLCGHYGDLNRDFLMAGAILHDIGKIKELEIKGGFSYSTEGELIGHPILGVLIAREKIEEIPGFPTKIAMLLEHMIISHHGQLEYGAAKLPVFREAILLTFIDEIDAKLNLVNSFTEDEAIPKPDEIWSDKCWYLDNRRLLRIDRYIKGY